MPTPNNSFFTMLPSSQNVTWTRNTPFPVLQEITIGATSDAIITFEFNFENTNIDWLFMSGSVSPDFNIVEIPTGKVTPVCKDLNLLTGNFYSAKIIFTRGLTTRIHTVNLTIIGTYSPIKSDKDVYSLVYNRITNTISGDTTVILNNTNSENVSFETVGSTLFLEKTGITDFTLEEDPAFPFATNTEFPTTGTKNVGCRLKDSSGNVVYNFTISVTIINTNDITTDQASLLFSQFKHLSESKSAVLKLINPANLNFTLTAPAFLTVNPTSGNSSVNITVNTLNSSVLNAQTYNGDLSISYNSKVLKVPVTLNNIDYIDFPIGDYNFCLDKFYLTVHRISDAARLVRISLEIVLENSEGSETVNTSYQIAYYQDKATTDIGTKVHNHFTSFAKPIFENPGIDFNNIFVYKPAIVKVTIDELDANYTVVFTKSYSNIKLFPGKKPKMFPVFTNSQVKRIYADSAYIFSYLTDLVEPSDIVGDTVSSNPYLPGEVHSVFFEDSDEIMSFGDYLQVLGIDFIRIPKGDDQIYFQYINENLVPELFVFNGDYFIEENYEHNYEDDENFARKYDCKIVGKMTVNTGFIFKEESAALSQLNRRNLGFMKIQNDVYKVFPVTSKFRRIDSAQNVNNYELEFLIVEYGN